MMFETRGILNFVLISGLFSAALALVPNRADAAWFNCAISGVWEDKPAQQLFVSCSNSTQGRSWFSIETAQFSSQEENRFISMASAALLARRYFRVNHTGVACPGSIWQAGQCYLVNKWSVFTPQ